MIDRLIIVNLLSLWDVIATLHWTNKFGLDVEANPLMKPLLQFPELAIMVKLLIALIGTIILFLCRSSNIAKIGSWILVITYGILGLYHVFLFVYVYGILKLK